MDLETSVSSLLFSLQAFLPPFSQFLEHLLVEPMSSFLGTLLLAQEVKAFLSQLTLFRLKIVLLHSLINHTAMARMHLLELLDHVLYLCLSSQQLLSI
jgi:hypothetical protein